MNSSERHDEPIADTPGPGPLSEAMSRLREARGGADPRGRELVRARLFGENAEAQRIGRYVLTRYVGGGAMGHVYAARDEYLDRMVALKCIRPGAVEESARKRFSREARAMARLSHPNVATVYEIGQEGSQLYIALEFVEGNNLHQWVSTQSPSWSEIVEVYRQAAEGLGAAHRQGLVHRDFKPHNAMLGSDGRVRVVDFGLAARVPDDRETSDNVASEAVSALCSASTLTQSRLTATGGLVGSPAYMAPEQLAGLSADARSDQFSFCVSLFEALYGHRPFDARTLRVSKGLFATVPRRGGKAPFASPQNGRLAAPTRAQPFAGQALDLVEHVRSERLLLPPARDTPVPDWIGGILRRGLAFDPRDRWPSMEALAAALARDPTRRRRIVRLLGGLGFTAVAAVGWQGLERSRAEAACESSEHSMAPVWNDERRAALMARAAATKSATREDYASRLAGNLDARAAAWSEISTRVCREARIEETRYPHSALQAHRCLDEFRTRIDALIEAVQSGDDRALAEGLLASATLPHVSLCADERSLALRSPPPTDPTLAKRVHGARRELARIRGADLDGDPLALERAEALWDEARRLDDAPLLAEIRYAIAEVHEAAGRHEEASEAFEQAFSLADSAGHDYLALQAAARLARLHAIGRQTPHESMQWYRLADAKVKRMGLKDDLAEALALAGLGALHDVRGDYDEALEAYRQALSIQERILGSEHVDLATTYADIGNAHERLGNVEDGLAAFRRGLALLEAELGPHHLRLAATLNGIGNLYNESGEYEQAIAIFERILESYRRNGRTSHPNYGGAWINLGNGLERLERYDEALESYRTAIESLEPVVRSDHPILGIAYANEGLLLADRGELEQAPSRQRRALEIFERSLGPEHPELILISKHIGNTQRKLGRFDQALGTYQRALTIARMHPEYIHAEREVLLANIGRVHQEQGRPDLARSAFLEAVELASRGDDDRAGLAEVYFDAAQALWSVAEHRSRARVLAERARTLHLRDAETEDVARIEAWLARHPALVP